MPRVVPSQVVAVIDNLFPWARSGPPEGINAQQRSGLSALLSLTRDIPPELITLEGPEYARYVLAREAIEYTLNFWLARATAGAAVGSNLFAAGGDDPLVLLRRCLAKCADEAASPETAELSFMADADLRESIRRDISAANQDFVNGEWKGATVLAGSATEALLLWAIGEADKRKAGSITAALSALVSAKTLPGKPSNDPDRWDLAEYIEVALHLSLITPNTAIQARLGKDFRNLIHPGRSARLGQVCDRPIALSALAAVEHVARDVS